MAKPLVSFVLGHVLQSHTMRIFQTKNTIADFNATVIAIEWCEDTVITA